MPDKQTPLTSMPSSSCPVCPIGESRTRVVATMDNIRKRQCLRCGLQFNTIEMVMNAEMYERRSERLPKLVPKKEEEWDDQPQIRRDNKQRRIENGKPEGFYGPED